MPHSPYPVSSPYGAPRPTGPHSGEDYKMPVGTKLYAPANGRVEHRDGPTFGIQVWVISGTTEYLLAHLSKRRVGDGYPVSAGQLVAESGNTGNSTGPHLHLGVRVNGSWVDPAPRRGALFHPASVSSQSPSMSPVDLEEDVILFKIEGDGRVFRHMGNWKLHIDGGTYARLVKYYGAPDSPNAVQTFSAADGWGQLPESPPVAPHSHPVAPAPVEDHTHEAMVTLS